MKLVEQLWLTTEDLLLIESPDAAMQELCRLPLNSLRFIQNKLGNNDSQYLSSYQNLSNALNSGKIFLVKFHRCWLKSPAIIWLDVDDDRYESNASASRAIHKNFMVNSSVPSHIQSQLKFLYSNAQMPINAMSQQVSYGYETESAAQSSNESADYYKIDKTKEKKEPNHWVKIRAMYDDLWDTPLPAKITLYIDDNVHEQGVELACAEGKNTYSGTLKQAQATESEPGVALFKDIPDGKIVAEIEKDAGEEENIKQLKNELSATLDGAYRGLVEDMTSFQEDWDKYSYASLVLDYTGGFWDGCMG
ncbi:hypothetical protein [Marinicellulosiphila megalodicopiae]|uniref:hypothetical protein n=1 Tax=Marinicellulosiphila megalodicopiae TaxID=2724896 RepID=UPI003BAF437A